MDSIFTWKNKWQDKPLSLRLKYLADVFVKIEMDLLIQENNGQYFLSMIKFELSSKNLESENLCMSVWVLQLPST